ncbi:MAG: YeiH family protein [Rhodoglobus sp.]
MTDSTGTRGLGRFAPLIGLGIAAVGLLIAFGIHWLVPAVPVLTACVVLGVLFTALPWSSAVKSAARPGFTIASKRLLRIGIVLLGFSLSLVDVARLGWATLIAIVLVVLLTFFLTLAVGRIAKLPGDQPLLIAAGFSICGASAIGAMSAVTGSKDEETATPIALVTLCGTLAIAVLPALAPLFGLNAEQFGMWVGASVHDVGQVVATAQIAGASALAVAVVVKLTRVVMLAPMIAIAGIALKGREREGARPPIVPLFVVGFLAAVLLRTFLPLPEELLAVIAGIQHVLLGLALFALGAAIRIGALVRTGGRPLAVAGISWLAIAALSLGAVWVVS